MTKPKGKVLPSKTVAYILDEATKHKGYNRIAEEAGCSPSTAMEVLRDFPLWNWFREQQYDGRKVKK